VIFTAVDSNGNEAYLTAEVLLLDAVEPQGDIIFNLEINNPSSEIDEVEFTFEFYPNPAEDLFKLSLEVNNSNAEEVSIEIISLLGQKVYEQKLEAGNHSIDISELTSGLYFIKASTTNYTLTKRLTVK